jgi:hypothetical protein
MADGESELVQSSLLESVTSPYVKYFHEAPLNVNIEQVPFVSANNQTWTCNFVPATYNTLVDRRLMVKAKVYVKCTNNNELDFGAPRAFPLASVMKTLTININGQSISSQPQQTIRLLERINSVDDAFRSIWWSQTPSYPDMGTYVKMPPTILVQNTNLAMDVNVANSYSHIPIPYSPFVEPHVFVSARETSRAGFPIKTKTATSQLYSFSEHLVHPLTADSEDVAWSNVSKLSISMTFDADLTKLFSAYKPIAGLGVELSGLNVANTPPVLLVTTVSPKDPSVIPSRVEIDYTELVVNESQVLKAVAINESTTVNVPAMIYSQIPSHLYIAVCQDESTRTYEDPDCYGVIESIRMQVGNRAGLLSGCSQEQLYDISRKSGVNLSWTQWSSTVGSILIINLSDALGGVHAGLQSNIPISFQITFTNRRYAVFSDNENTAAGTVTASPFDYVVRYWAQMSGRFMIAPEKAQLEMGLTGDDIWDAMQKEPLTAKESDMIAKGLYRGSSLKSGWRKFARFAKKAMAFATPGLGLLKALPGPQQAFIQNAANVADVVNPMIQQQGKGLLQYHPQARR